MSTGTDTPDLNVIVNDDKTALVGDRLVRAGENGIYASIAEAAKDEAATRGTDILVEVSKTGSDKTNRLQVSKSGDVTKVPATPQGPQDSTPSQEVTAPQAPQSAAPQAPSAPPVKPAPQHTQTPPQTPTPPPAPAELQPVPPQPQWNPPAPQLYTPEAPAALPAIPDQGPDSWVRNRVKSAPESGWRRAAYVLTGGAWNPGENPADIKRRELDQILRTPIAERGYSIAMISAKGGVSKTSTTIGLANALAETRMDSVLGIDANPHAGNLAERGGNDKQTRFSITDLLNKRLPDGSTAIEGITDVRYFTAGSTQRADFLASDHTPGRKLTREEYDEALTIVRKHYGIVLTDCGTGLEDNPVVPGILDEAKTIVIPTTPKDDGARTADLTLDWIEAQGWGHLLSRAVVVVSIGDSGKTLVDVDAMVRHFQARAQHVHVIPYDRHLAEGGIIHTDRFAKETYDAYRDLAALIAPDFAEPTGSHALGARLAG